MMIKRRLISSVLLFVLCSAVLLSASAQSGPEELKKDAFDKILLAKDVFAKANNLLYSGKEKENLLAAMQLYAQAGEMFQEASNVLKYLGPKYVDQYHIDGCNNAVITCLKAINDIKRVLKDKR